MKIQHFLSRVDHDRIHQVLKEAEKGTSGRVVVYISPHLVRDGLEAAHEIFRKLQLESEHQKAGFLLFLAPRTHRFAVLGGTALHEKLGQAWWDKLTGTLGAEFRQEHYTQGILTTLEEVSRTLKAHFPRDDSQREDTGP